MSYLSFLYATSYNINTISDADPFRGKRTQILIRPKVQQKNNKNWKYEFKWKKNNHDFLPKIIKKLKYFFKRKNIIDFLMYLRWKKSNFVMWSGSATLDLRPVFELIS